jgi:hypothetical protein
MAHRGCGTQKSRGLLKRCVPPDALARQQEPSPLRRRLLLLVLTLTFVRGILYLAIFPPWQHYDEPTHFEYVRLIATRGRLPQPGDHDLAMQQKIAASMQAADFWKEGQAPTIDFGSDKSPDIGISELYHPPLYYMLVALPQWLATHQSVEVQLYLARFGSVLLYVVIVTAVYGLLTELLAHKPWMSLVIATFVALLPPFTALMSAVNNDAGAAAATTLLLWASVRLVRRGLSPGRIGSVLLLTGACIATKNTASAIAVAILLVLVVIYISRSQRRWLGAGLALLALIALVTILNWGKHASHWYGDEHAAASTRIAVQTPLGRSAFVLSADGTRYPHTIFQELCRAEGQALRGHTVTLGTWLKAAQAPTGSSGKRLVLQLDDGRGRSLFQIEATDEWQFYAFTTTIGIDARGVAISASIPKDKDAARQVYLDGLVLVDSEIPLNQLPQFETDQAAKGQWAGQQVTNLLKNGSAEGTWLGLRTWVGDQTIYRQPVFAVLYSLGEWPRTAWVYGPELVTLLQSFWGGFGWNHLRLPAPCIYLLSVVTGMGVLGSGIGLVRRVKSGHCSLTKQWAAWGLLGVALLVGWGGAVLRIHPVFITRHISWPVARYASVVIAPTAAFLCLGWAEIIPRRWTKEAAWLGLLALLLLEMAALWTVILPYYYGGGS